MVVAKLHFVVACVGSTTFLLSSYVCPEQLFFCHCGDTFRSRYNDFFWHHSTNFYSSFYHAKIRKMTAKKKFLVLGKWLISCNSKNCNWAKSYINCIKNCIDKNNQIIYKLSVSLTQDQREMLTLHMQKKECSVEVCTYQVKFFSLHKSL